VKIQVEVQGPQWLARSPRRARRLAVATVAILVLAIPAAVWASDKFFDVPDDQPFHNQISAIAGAGITTGCGDPAARTYCPTEFVRRDAMAAFMHRGFGRVTLDDLGFILAVPTTESAPVGWTHTMTPGVPSNALAGAQGFIKTDATITLLADDLTGCPCQIRGALFVTGVGYMVSYYTDVTLDTLNQRLVMAMTGAIPVGSGTKTVEVRLFRVSGGDGTNIEAYGNVTSTYYPFGGSGTNTLGLSTDELPSGPNTTGN
jgi:hypothetical protein